MKRAVVVLFAVVLGVLAGGGVMAVLVPQDPARYGPGTAILVTLGCIGVLVGVAAYVTRGKHPEPD